MKKVKTWLIYNPISGGKSKSKIIDFTVKSLPDLFGVKVIKTEYAGHAKLLAESAVKENINLIIAIGGDGTFHEIATAIIQSDTAMAMIPTGSGNGFARYFDNDLSTHRWVRKIIYGKPTAVDTVLFNDSYFINAAGIGFDADVAHQFSNSTVRGFKKYVFEVAKALFKIKLVEINEHKNILMCSFLNGKQFGNNFILDPDAEMKDGEMTIVLVKKGNIFEMLQFALMAFHGKAHYSKLVSLEKGNSFELESKSTKAHFDGEPIVLNKKKHHVKVVPLSLKIWL